MAYRRKKTEGSSLAFLDIMSCGLGAVILVFMLVKQKIDETPVEIDNLKQDISQLEQVRDDAETTLGQIREQLSSENARYQALKKQLDDKQSTLESKSQQVQRSESELDELKSSITSIEVPQQQQDLVEAPRINEENYLLGLKVEGPKIAILVDTSASMTNEKLIDIIRTKSSSQQNKKNAAKWQRTKKVVEWLLARTPENSDVVVVAFSEDAKVLGDKKGWQKAKASQTIASIMSDLNSIVPEGATNLQKGLNTVNQFSPTNLYVITDGLPTKGESQYRSLNPFSSCSSLTGNAQTISGECRVKLFQQTLNESGKRGVQVDVIMLPLEGDPDAVNQYWIWAATTGGLLISPASNWP